MGPSQFTTKSTTFSEAGYHHTLQWCVCDYFCMFLFLPHLVYQDRQEKKQEEFCTLEVQGPAPCQYFTEKKVRQDADDDSGVFTDTKSTTTSEVSYTFQ